MSNDPHRFALENALGRKMDMVRVYSIADAMTADVPPVVSVKWGHWADVAAGKANALILRDLGRLLPLARPGILVPHHEPENDVSTYGTHADYQAMFAHVRTLVLSHLPGWPIWSCLIGDTFGKLDSAGNVYGVSNGGPAAWVPASADGIAIDKYDWRGAMAAPPYADADPTRPLVDATAFYEPFRRFAASVSLPMAVFEYGAPRVAGEHGEIQSATIARLAAVWHDAFEVFGYFDSDVGDPNMKTDCRIDPYPASVAAFAAFASFITPPVPVDPCADVKAALAAAQAQITADNANIATLAAGNAALQARIDAAKVDLG